jgi:hypothetical protein
MRASLELLNNSLILSILDGHGNPARVLFGGNDGILITINPNGKITVLPPEGPGDPELRAAFKSLNSSLGKIGGFFEPCIVIEEQMGKIEEEIVSAERGLGQLPPGVTIASLNQQLGSLSNKLRQEKCGG